MNAAAEAALRGDYPGIEWDRIAGMRDRLAHDYSSVDLNILREVLEERLPRLLSSIEEILGTS